MTDAARHDRRHLAISLAIFTASVLGMAYLRLIVFPTTFIALTYALPLLLCIWHQDRRLLWSMSAAFAGLAAVKAFVRLDDGDHTSLELWLHYGQQLANIGIVAVAVHRVVDLTTDLRRRNETIERQNEELTAQAEELAQQNEEIQQQNEEIQQQNEEVTQQTEELQAQAEELQVAYTESERREALLQSLMESLEHGDAQEPLPAGLSASLLALFDGNATGATIAERIGDRFVDLSRANADADGTRPAAGTFGAIVMEQGRTAYIEDLRAREDIEATSTGAGAARSALATPLRLGREMIGVVEVVSAAPRQWTKGDFRLIEWIAVQCGLVLQTRRLRQALEAGNERLDGEVRERTSRLLETVEELEHFSYTITHDLRAPLRSMQGFAQLLEERYADGLDVAGRDYLGRIGTAARRMDRLITDALSYSRIAREELPLAEVDLRALIEGMLASYPSLQPPAAVIRVEPLPPVLGNEAGLTQVFSNLLGNAVKFVPAGRLPEVRIHGERTDGTVRICVADNGIGIAPENHERVFQMFQRVSKDYDGTGIGLALVRKIAGRMGGSVTLESEPGAGCRFWVELRAAGVSEG